MGVHSGENKISERLARHQEIELSVEPPFPRHLSIELSNVCNHSCTFCAYSIMERSKGNINVERLERWLQEAYDLGAREIGLHSGAEPFASPHLEHFTAYVKQIGYEYAYISTNGSLGVPKRMEKVIDAGMDSIKFSINAGDRETYQKVHGKDHFDLVLEHLRFAHRHRAGRKRPYLAISFVETEENRHTVDRLRELTREIVDEFLSFRASNQNGQMPGAGSWTPSPSAKDICSIPFNRLHISWEGFVRVCCNDYENLLALDDLGTMSLREAYYSHRYRDIRRRHLEDKLEGSLCYNCKYDCAKPVQPLNPDLYFRTHKSDDGPPVSYSPKIFRRTEFDPAPASG